MPVQVEAEHEPTQIQDLDRVQAGPSGVRRPVGRPPKKEKRPRILLSDTEDEAPRIGGRYQGEKRSLDTDDEHQPEKKAWLDIADDADTGTEMSSEDEVSKIPDKEGEVTISIPEGAKPPTAQGCGWIFAANQSLTLQPGTAAAIDLGLRAAIPRGTSLLLLSRSRLAVQGITTVTCPIDYHHRGAITAILQNSSNVPRRITKGEKICHGIITPTVSAQWVCDSGGS